MKADFTLTLGAFLIFGLCALHVKAEVSVQSFSSPSIGQQLSRAARTEHVDGDPSLPAVSYARLSKRARSWTPEEEELLLKLRSKRMSWDEIEKRFPGRSWTALQQKYNKLTPKSDRNPVKYKSWTKEEQDLLLELVEANKTWREIGEFFPGRSTETIYGKYRYLTKGNPVPKRVQESWTAEENELLIRLAKEKVPWEGRVTFFKNRSLVALRNQSSKLASPTLHTGKYNPEEDKILIEALESGMMADDITGLLNRNVKSIKRRMRMLEKQNKLDPPPQEARKRYYKAADFELMQKSVEQGMSWKDIAEGYFPGRPYENMDKAYQRYQREKKKKKGRKEEED